MTSGEIVGLIVTIALSLGIVSMGIVLLTDRGSFLIAGFNTLPKSEKDKFDVTALCRFIGKILLCVALLFPLLAVGGILNIPWLTAVFIIGVIGLVVFAAIYANTGNRFKK